MMRVRTSISTTKRVCPDGPRMRRTSKSAATRVLRDVQRDVEVSASCDEVAGVVSLVASDGDTPCPRQFVIEHLEDDVALDGNVGLGDAQVDEQAVSVLHQSVLRVGEARAGVVRLARQPRLGVRRRVVRLVAALLAVEVDGRVARVVRGGAVAGLVVLGAEALVRGPGVDQRDMRPARRACATMTAKDCLATSCSMRRARFFVNVVGSKLSSTMSMSRNQRKSRL